MSQAKVPYIPPPYPDDKALHSGYPVPYPMFQAANAAFPESLVPSLNNLGNCWPPVPHDVVPTAHLQFDGSQSADLMGLNSDQLWGCESLLPNALPQGLPVTPKDEIPFNTTISSVTPYIVESSPSTEPSDLQNLPGGPTTPQFHPPPPPPPPPPSERQELPQPRSRRNSAPELSAHDLAEARQRQLKHASRRASHNIVEKRYRINLNSKFRKLEEVVLKGTEPYSASSSSSSSSKNAASSARRQQSPKASIIDSALGYIESLQSEINVLNSKLEFFQKPAFGGNREGGRSEK